ncbi:MAG: AAC(3) family N-acetyltransferase [Lachnospiraceae bacterium]|nr:AAC(3) family N-acetyltransferase [Lachnospiraceae bacterium]
MYTKEELKKHLKNMGLNGSEAIMVHSSMKAIGEVDGGADTVVDTFMEYFREGMFMTPAHTWAQIKGDHLTFNPKTEPVCVGIIPNLFLKRPGVVRSLHPTHSLAAYGKEAADFIKGEEKATTPCPPGGCWDRLREVNAQILLLGVPHGRNTFIHSVDEVLNIKDRLTDEPTLMHIVMPDGSIKDVSMYRHYNRFLESGSFSDHFNKLEDIFYRKGAAQKCTFGDADCILCDANKIFEVCKIILEKDETCIIEKDRIPDEYWSE